MFFLIDSLLISETFLRNLLEVLDLLFQVLDVGVSEDGVACLAGRDDDAGPFDSVGGSGLAVGHSVHRNLQYASQLFNEPFTGGGIDRPSTFHTRC